MESKAIQIWPNVESDNPLGYKLLDSGNGCKLEEVGGVRIARPEPRAWWKTSLESKQWEDAVAYFDKGAKGTVERTLTSSLREDGKKGEWKFKKEIPEEMVID